MMKDIKIVPAGQVDDSQDENLKIIIGKKGSEETFLAYGDLPGIILLPEKIFEIVNFLIVKSYPILSTA